MPRARAACGTWGASLSGGEDAGRVCVPVGSRGSHRDEGEGFVRGEGARPAERVDVRRADRRFELLPPRPQGETSVGRFLLVCGSGGVARPQRSAESGGRLFPRLPPLGRDDGRDGDGAREHGRGEVVPKVVEPGQEMHAGALEGHLGGARLRRLGPACEGLLHAGPKLVDGGLELDRELAGFGEEGVWTETRSVGAVRRRRLSAMGGALTHPAVLARRQERPRVVPKQSRGERERDEHDQPEQKHRARSLQEKARHVSQGPTRFQS